MENIIWTNDTGQIDAIIEDWRQDALALAAAMAENPRGTVDETEYGTGLILEKAWEAVVDEYEIPTPRRLSDAIRSIDASDTRIRAEADDLNAEYRMDERMNLSGLGLDHPVIILGKAGLWDGTRTIASIVAFDNIGGHHRRQPMERHGIRDVGHRRARRPALQRRPPRRGQHLHLPRTQRRPSRGPDHRTGRHAETAQGKPSPRPANPQGIRHAHAREKTREPLKENQEYHNSVI